MGEEDNYMWPVDDPEPQELGQSSGASCSMPSWWPDNPYPKKLCKAQTLEEIEELLKDKARLATVAWFFMGDGYETARKYILEELKKHLEL